MSAYLKNKAKTLLYELFGGNSDNIAKVMNLVKTGIVANKTSVYRCKAMRPGIFFLSNKLGGMPAFNFEKHGFKLLNSDAQFPIFELEGSKMQFIAQFSLHTNEVVKNKEKTGMLFFFIEYQDINNYEESCPSCKVIFEPLADSYSKEYKATLNLSQDSINLYHTGYHLENCFGKISLPHTDLLKQKYPSFFSETLLENYRNNILPLFDAKWYSIIFMGNPIALQHYPVNQDSELLLQLTDPRDVPTDRYTFYFTIKKEDLLQKNFSNVTHVIGQST
jgi:uncharacterized protein YwqG